MVRKRTADERRRCAEENGFNDDDTDVDDEPVPREVLDYTKERSKDQMDLWIDKPTIQTVRNYFRCFVSGWNLDNLTCLISKDFTDSITNYIKGPLRKELGLSIATRPKKYLTLENYMYLEKQLWQNDGYDYVHEAYRVFISGKLKCHVFTPARLGEISDSSTRRSTEKGLRYKETVMLVAWKDGEPELRFSLKREFAKAMHDKEQQRSAKSHTLKEVLDVRPPANQRYWVLEWSSHVLDLPVFPEVSVDGATNKIQTGNSFNTQLKALSIRAGISPVTVHSMRREALILATANGYSNRELMKFAAHTNKMTLTRDYLSSITVVDGLAGFLKLPLRSDQAEDFRSMTVNRNPELLQSLPAKTHDQLRQREDYVAITKKIDDLTHEISCAQKGAAARDLKSERGQLYEQRRVLEEEESNRIRGDQERIHPSERKEKVYVDQYRSRFDRLLTLFCVAPMRSPEGESAIEDLISLVKNNCRVAYQPSLRPLRTQCAMPYHAAGRCQAQHCGVDMCPYCDVEVER
ncbi:hypothetical protein B0T26DRAFT_740895 [Lasiosphaeria miniovina]|uniref:Uncharacterized protein n=1 Tax=Lasiosphaeria miniovina TaxID=1954250 RepID=A0AA40AKL6_9PEZI|nr:uncharacterized protein B0T26DRAFT_740895 [Lasiosphaeria miniovina]KAK0717568.1 hypothetical protein B0T26DRAFT_740895 [Lasiosphaeria miniovina]